MSSDRDRSTDDEADAGAETEAETETETEARPPIETGETTEERFEGNATGPDAVDTGSAPDLEGERVAPVGTDPNGDRAADDTDGVPADGVSDDRLTTGAREAGTDTGEASSHAEGAAPGSRESRVGTDGPTADGTGLGPDAIKRFTAAALDAAGGEIERDSESRWFVALPGELAAELGYETATLAFDRNEKEPGDVLVVQGTRFLTALTDRVERSGGVGRCRLDAETLDLRPPSTLREAAGFDVTVEEFVPRSDDVALVFHFRVELLSVSTYQREELASIAVDPTTRTTLPDLADRLIGTLPRLLEANAELTDRETGDEDDTNDRDERSDDERANDDRPPAGEPRIASVERPREDYGSDERSRPGAKSPSDTGRRFDREAVTSAYRTAKRAALEAVEPAVAEFRMEVERAVEERCDELAEWYEARREESAARLAEKRAEVEEWRENYENARSDETRLRYLRERREAEAELDELEDEVEREREALRAEERERIEETIDRHRIDVDLDLIGVTEVTYERGRLTLGLTDGRTTLTRSLSAVPATGTYYGLECPVCEADLLEAPSEPDSPDGEVETDIDVDAETDVDPDPEPRPEPGSGADSRPGPIDRSPRLCVGGHLVCASCAIGCRACDRWYCEECPAADDRLTTCGICGSRECTDCTAVCTECGTAVCSEHRANCTECEAVICDAHGYRCETCDGTLCPAHATTCAHCRGTPTTYCERHAERCVGGGEVVCAEHAASDAQVAGTVCREHVAACALCRVEYAQSRLDDGRCPACRNLSEALPDDPAIRAVAREFTSVAVGTTSTHAVIYGKRRLRRDEVVVLDRRSDEEIRRVSASLRSKFTGRP